MEGIFLILLVEKNWCGPTWTECGNQKWNWAPTDGETCVITACVVGARSSGPHKQPPALNVDLAACNKELAPVLAIKAGLFLLDKLQLRFFSKWALLKTRQPSIYQRARQSPSGCKGLIGQVVVYIWCCTEYLFGIRRGMIQEPSFFFLRDEKVLD